MVDRSDASEPSDLSGRPICTTLPGQRVRSMSPCSGCGAIWLAATLVAESEPESSVISLVARRRVVRRRAASACSGLPSQVSGLLRGLIDGTPSHRPVLSENFRLGRLTHLGR